MSLLKAIGAARCGADPRAFDPGKSYLVIHLSPSMRRELLVTMTPDVWQYDRGRHNEISVYGMPLWVDNSMDDDAWELVTVAPAKIWSKP